MDGEKRRGLGDIYTYHCCIHTRVYAFAIGGGGDGRGCFDIQLSPFDTSANANAQYRTWKLAVEGTDPECYPGSTTFCLVFSTKRAVVCSVGSEALNVS